MRSILILGPVAFVCWMVFNGFITEAVVSTILLVLFFRSAWT